MIKVEKYRERLMEELSALTSDLTESTHGTQTVELDQTSVGRLSRMDAMQQQAMAKGLYGRLKIRRLRILAAIDRLDAGKFGLCCECGIEIEPERLNVDATCLFCVACAEAR
jgi:DnaK suppressor protein